MKSFDLKRIPPPPPPPDPKLCVTCKGFRAECVVPVGEGSAPMCWLCAHHVVDHERELHEAATAECGCAPHEIYPGREAPTVDELIAERLRCQPLPVTTFAPAIGGSTTGKGDLARFVHGDGNCGCRPHGRACDRHAVTRSPGFAASVATVKVIRQARETWEEDRFPSGPRATRGERSATVAPVTQYGKRRKSS